MFPVKDAVIGLGLSGGIDSAFVGYLLKQAGYKVQAFTMLLNPNSNCERAIAIAAKLDIPHRMLDLQEEFETGVIANFVRRYAEGYTPSPCVFCNREFKFGLMLKAIQDYGCTHLATGHYARALRNGAGQIRLLRGLDPIKEQSYFLAQLNQQQLEKAVFPLGSLHKNEVAKQARSLGLLSEGQAESQDLCFLQDADYTALIATRRPELNKEGRIVDLNGKQLGWHEGAFRYTRGQRKGLGLGGGPWFVLKTDMAENLVVVGSREDLKQKTVLLEGMNWLLEDENQTADISCMAQIRYRMQAQTAKLRKLPERQAVLEFDEYVYAVTPGQLAVCYQEDRVIASGWIAS